MKKILLLTAMAGLFISVSSCKKSSSNDDGNNNTSTTPVTPEGMVKLGETYVPGTSAKAYLYAAENLFTGFNRIYAAFYDSVSGNRITDGHFHIEGEMDMGMMQHGCPGEEIEEPVNNLFQSNVVFTMPGTWKLNLHFHNHTNDKEGEGEINLAVSDKSPARLVSTVLAGDDSAKVFVSFVLPTKAKSGLNDAEFTIHKKAADFDFPAVENYTIEMIPTMPSMGHGSPNNVNPVHTANGHYAGKVNFTMTGLWRIQLKLYKNGTLLTDQIYFDITI